MPKLMDLNPTNTRLLNCVTKYGREGKTQIRHQMKFRMQQSMVLKSKKSFGGGFVSPHMAAKPNGFGVASWRLLYMFCFFVYFSQNPPMLVTAFETRFSFTCDGYKQKAKYP